MAAFSAGVVTVNSAATSITTTPAASCETVIRNDGNGMLWVSSDVAMTAGNGYLIRPGEVFRLTTATAVTVYGCASSTNANVYWIRSV